MAQDGLLFKWAAAIHPTYRTPGRAILLQGFWAVVLVLTGTATHPTGVFQGRSGRLVIASANDEVIQGRFTVEARGFLASSPDDESRPMQATGMFTATRQSGGEARGSRRVDPRRARVEPGVTPAQ